MSTFTKAISRASLSIAIGALSSGLAVAAAEKLFISKLSAGLLAIGLFFIGSMLGTMLHHWIQERKVKTQSDQELIVALEHLMDRIPDVATEKMNNEIDELTRSIARLKTQMATRGINYTPQEKPFVIPSTSTTEKSEALRMCLNAKKLLDFAISMGDSEENIVTLTEEVDHWLHILNQRGGNVQGQA